MKSIHHILLFLACTYAGFILQGQEVNDSVSIRFQNKNVTVKPKNDESYTTVKFKDTALDKEIIVKVAVRNHASFEKKLENQLDSQSKKVYDFMKIKNYGEDREKFIETSFFPTFDLGFASTMNDKDNSSAITPKISKSANIGIGLVRQDMNLLKGRLLISYGLNLNNYYLKYDNKQMLQYLDENDLLKQTIDTVNNYRKNRFDVRYVSVPILLEYHSKKNRFNIAAGVEFSFNGHTKYVLKGDNKGQDFKQKNDTPVKINPTQLSAVLRLGIDDIAIFGKYSISEMYRESAYAPGQDPMQHLFSFGVCFFGI